MEKKNTRNSKKNAMIYVLPSLKRNMKTFQLAWKERPLSLNSQEEDLKEQLSHLKHLMDMNILFLFSIKRY